MVSIPALRHFPNIGLTFRNGGTLARLQFLFQRLSGVGPVPLTVPLTVPAPSIAPAVPPIAPHAHPSPPPPSQCPVRRAVFPFAPRRLGRPQPGGLPAWGCTVYCTATGAAATEQPQWSKAPVCDLVFFLPPRPAPICTHAHTRTLCPAPCAPRLCAGQPRVCACRRSSISSPRRMRSAWGSSRIGPTHWAAT